MFPMAEWLDSISKLVTGGALGSVGTWLTQRSSAKNEKAAVSGNIRQLPKHRRPRCGSPVLRRTQTCSGDGLQRQASSQLRHMESLHDEKRREMLFDLPEAGGINRLHALFTTMIKNALSCYPHLPGQGTATP